MVIVRVMMGCGHSEGNDGCGHSEGNDGCHPVFV